MNAPLHCPQESLSLIYILSLAFAPSYEPSYNEPPCEAPMPFSLRPFSRFPICTVSYNAGPFQGQGTIWNFSCTGWRLSGDLPMRPGQTLSLTVTLPNEQRIEIPEAVVR